MYVNKRYMIDNERMFFDSFEDESGASFLNRETLQSPDLSYTNQVLLIYIFNAFQTALPGIMDTGVKRFVQKIAWDMQIVIILMGHAVTVVKQDT